MAARKSKAPPAGEANAAASTDVMPDESGGANSDVSSETPAAPEAGGEATEPPADGEARIRQAAARKLEEKQGDLSVRLTKSEARANGLQGELDREKSARQSAEARVSALEVELAAARTAAHNAGQKLDGLPEGAYQLNECVTIESASPGKGKGGRLHAKQNDVLFVTNSDAAVAELQQQLGLQTTVYRATAKTIEDLQDSGFLHA